LSFGLWPIKCPPRAAGKKKFLVNASMAFDMGKATQSFKDEITDLMKEAVLRALADSRKGLADHEPN